MFSFYTAYVVQTHTICLFFFKLILAVLGLRCCAQAFSSCGKRGPLFLQVCGLLTAVASLAVEHGLQARRLQQLWLAGSGAQAQYLWRMGFVAPWHVGSSRTRARTCVPCIGRRSLNHCATREAPICLLQQTNNLTKNAHLEYRFCFVFFL